MLNLGLKILREREKLSAAGYLFVVFIRATTTVIYSVLLSGKMIIYILQSLDPPSQACLPLHTQNNPYISPGSRLSV